MAARNFSDTGVSQEELRREGLRDRLRPNYDSSRQPARHGFDVNKGAGRAPCGSSLALAEQSESGRLLMERYDPDKSIDPGEWMALDEGEREYIVEQYHRRKRIKMPSLRMHAMFHVVVENQIALGDEIPTQKTLLRLMREGLSRHDAVHAIGSVVASHMFNLVKHGPTSKDPNTDYYRKLEGLTADSWLNSSNDESEEE
jgi:hypothetical protein